MFFDLFIVLCIFIFAQVLVYFWAKNGKKGFKFRTEGTAELVYENGEFSNRAILAYSGHRFAGELPKDATDDIDNLKVFDIVPSPNSKAVRKTQEWLLNIFFPIHRVVWVGWPGVSTIGHQISVKEEDFTIHFTNSELADGIPFDIEVKGVRRVVNPALAILRVEGNDYRKKSDDFIHDALDMDFRSLLEKDFKENKAGLPGKLDDLFRRVLEATVIELTNHCGVAFHGLRISEIDPAGNMRELTLKKTVAEKAAEVKLIYAKADADALALTTAAEIRRDHALARSKAAVMGIVNTAASGMCDKAMRLEEMRTIKETGAKLTLINGLSLPSAVVTISADQKGGTE